ncbi:MAG TPA: MBL fold metallo-hydrolase [Caulobacteraceae bacterium]
MTTPCRRTVLRGALALPGLAALPAALRASAQTRATKLVLLGTLGGPSVGRSRYMTSNVILHGGAAHVVDCGYGVTEQLVRAGVQLQDIRDIFITHHHPDHNIELGTLIYFAWYAGMEAPLGLYGPPPLKRMTADYLEALKPDVDIWLEDIGHKPMGPVITHEISSAGPVMTSGDMRVTAAIVNHPPVVPALAYRFDFPDRSIVFSGDTTPVESVAQLAKGADVLVHEAMYLQAMQEEVAAVASRTTGGSAIAADRDKLWAHLMRSHSPAEQVGRIAAEAGVKTLVLAHLVPITGVSDAQWTAAVRSGGFRGEVIVGQDLMVI